MAIYSSKPREIKFLLIEPEIRNINRKHLKQFENWLYWKMSKSSCKNGEPSVVGAFSSKKKKIGVGNKPNTSQHFHPWFGSSWNAASKIHMHETDCQHDEFWRHGAIWTDLPLETKQAGTHQHPERLLQTGRPGRAPERWTLMLIADHWPCSHHTALLGWMYRIPGSVSEHGETELRPSCTAPGICLQKKHLQEQRDSRKLVAGRSSVDFLMSNSNWAHTVLLFLH